MSLTKFLQAIDKTFLGSIVRSKINLLNEADADYIYVENIRAFYSIPTRAAKFLCELAVRQKYYTRMYGIKCRKCKIILAESNDISKLPRFVECETCEIRGIEDSGFEVDPRTDIVVFYRLIDHSAIATT